MPSLKTIKKRQFTTNLGAFQIDGVPFKYESGGTVETHTSGVINKRNEGSGKVSQLCCDVPTTSLSWVGSIEYLNARDAKCALDKYSKGRYKITGTAIPCDVTAFMENTTKGQIRECNGCFVIDWKFIEVQTDCVEAV